MTTSSPPPRIEAAYFDAGRGEKWYVVDGPVDEGDRDRISGGPYPSRVEAQEEVDARYAEIQEHYEWVEAEARREGRTVTWSGGRR